MAYLHRQLKMIVARETFGRLFCICILLEIMRKSGFQKEFSYYSQNYDRATKDFFLCAHSSLLESILSVCLAMIRLPKFAVICCIFPEPAGRPRYAN